MSEISGVVSSLKREQKALKKRLRTIRKALRNLRGINVLIKEARAGFETGRRKYRHSKAGKAAISRAQKARWARIKKSGKLAPGKT